MNYKHLTILTIVIVALIIPRWNRQDLFISKFTGSDSRDLASKTQYKDIDFSIDSYEYVQYVNFFRGEDVKSEIGPPYTYRFLIPFVASFFPTDPLTSLNIINLLFLFIGLIYLLKTLKLLDYNDKTIFYTGLIYSFSFPVFYYGTVGILDPVLIGSIQLGIYLLLKDKFVSLNTLIFFMATANEKIVVLLPVIFIYHFKKSGFKDSIFYTLVPFVLSVVGIFLARGLAPDSINYVWKIDFNTLLDNLSRPRTYLSLILSGGIPAVLAHLGRNNVPKNDFFLALKIGVFTVYALIIYSMLAAYTDGRFIWIVYPFALPFAAGYIEKKLSGN